MTRTRCSAATPATADPRILLRVRLAGDDGLLEIVVNPRERGDYDYRLTVHLEVDDFRGTTSAWIVDEAWQAFLRDLRALEATRRGSAILQAMSSDELRIEFRATDRAGHMAFEGWVGDLGPVHTIKLQFSPVSFDPTELPRIVSPMR